MKLSRQNADDRVGSVIQRNHLSQYSGVSAVPLLPRGVTQYHRGWCAGQILTGTKVAPQDRRNTQRAKESIAHAGTLAGFGPRGRGQNEAPVLIRVQRSENCILLFPITVVGIGEVAALEQRNALEHPYQPRGVLIRQ